MASTSGPPTRSVMKRTAGAIKAGARKRRSSNRSRKRNPVGPLRATASILLAGLVPPTPKNGTRLGSRVRGILRLGVAEIALDKLTKVYPDGTRAVEELDLGIEDGLKKKPRTLSGGQRQRVAMGRSIVREPQAFLMDEPLSNLDAKLRVQ